MTRKTTQQATSSSIVIDPLTQEIRTPLPLTRDVGPTVAYRHRGDRSSSSRLTSGQMTPNSEIFSEHLDRYSSLSMNKGDQGSRSISHTGSSTPSTTLSDEEFLMSGPMNWDEDSVIASVDSGTIDMSVAQSQTNEFNNQEQKKEEIEDESYVGELMESDFVINLKETETIILFERADESVASDADYIDDVRSKNKKYEDLLEKKKIYVESFIDKSVQTLNKFYKNKNTDVPKQEVDDAECTVSAWEIFDEYEKLRQKEEREREEREQIASLSSKQTEEEENEEENFDEIDEIDDGDDEGKSIRSAQSGKSSNTEKDILLLPQFKESLMTMERMVVQNQFKDWQREYQSFSNRTSVKKQKIVEEEIEEEGSGTEKVSLAENDDTLKTIWNYSCPLSHNLNVNGMCWNKSNKDILAAAYGNITFDIEKKGLILCWTLKNPTYPERIIRIPHASVSSIDFSENNPSLLAAGFNDGSVAIYDIRRRDEEPVLETSKYHTGTVWDLQWVQRGKDMGERLHSVGVDGRVNSWAIRKGLECQEIMRLKRASRGPEFSEAFISGESGGMCIDAYPKDSNLYLVGTEDGIIYKCSCSYEQHLETYFGHTGPVYKVKWNPKEPNYFLSCSADWTVRVWNQDKPNPILTVESYKEEEMKESSCITDIAWNPYIATMFASVSITGDLEIWDLSHSALKPKFSKHKAGVKLNCVLFAKDSPCLLVGDNKGCIEVIKPMDIDFDAQQTEFSQLL